MVRKGMLGQVAAAVILVIGLVLAVGSRFEAEFPDVWPFLLTGGMGLSFFVRYGSGKGIGKAGLALAVIAGVGTIVACYVRWGA